jgi:hypothetical protein
MLIFWVWNQYIMWLKWCPAVLQVLYDFLYEGNNAGVMERRRSKVLCWPGYCRHVCRLRGSASSNPTPHQGPRQQSYTLTQRHINKMHKADTMTVAWLVSICALVRLRALCILSFLILCLSASLEFSILWILLDMDSTFYKCSSCWIYLLGYYHGRYIHSVWFYARFCSILDKFKNLLWFDMSLVANFLVLSSEMCLTLFNPLSIMWANFRGKFKSSCVTAKYF